MITNTARNIIFCVDDSKTPLLKSLMSNNPESFTISDCSKICLYKKKFCCYSTCEECETFGNKACYKQCPNVTEESNLLNYYCISVCTKELPFKLKLSDDCVPYCPIKDIQINNCELYYKENNTNLEDKILFCIQQDFNQRI